MATPFSGSAVANADAVTSWATQRIANRLPLWARARVEGIDSILQTIVNPFGSQFDELYAQLVQTQQNYYVTTAAQNDPAFLYTMQLPGEFEFASTEFQAGKLTFTPPTVEATVDTEPIVVNNIKDNDAENMERFWSLPTRWSATRLATGATNEILAATNIANLDSATINDADLRYTGKLFIEIADGDMFGWRDNRGIFTVPKVAIRGILVGRDFDDYTEEHIVFTTNSIQRSKYNWYSIDSIEVRGVEGSSATLTMTAGFDRRYLNSPHGMVITPLSEYQLLYSLTNNYAMNDDGGIGSLPFLQWNTFETNDLNLLTAGSSELITEHEIGIMPTLGEYFQEDLLDVELIPGTRWLAGVTTDKLYLIDGRLPHPLNMVTEDNSGETIVAKCMKQRSPGAELRLMVDKHDPIYSKAGGEVLFTTDHRKRTRGIVRTRLSVTIESMWAEPTTYYYDWSGNLLDILTHTTQAWVVSEEPSTLGGWLEKSLYLDLEDLAGCPFYVAYGKLETQFSDGRVEVDTSLVYSLYRVVTSSFDLPDGVKGKVASISIDSEDNLIVLTTDSEVWKLTMSYDYYIIDYYRNTMWFMEEYDSIEVITSV